MFLTVVFLQKLESDEQKLRLPRKFIAIGEIEDSQKLFFGANHYLVTLIEKRNKDGRYHILISPGQNTMLPMSS